MQVTKIMSVKSGIQGGLFLIVCMLLTVMAGAQQSFHRIYPAQKEKKLVTLTSYQIKDGHYVSMHIEAEPVGKGETIYADTLVFTSFKANGDIAWINTIQLDAAYTRIYQSKTSIIQGSNDSIYYSLVAEKDGKYTNIIGSISAGGNFGFMQSYGYNNTDIQPDGVANLLVNYKQTFFNAFSAKTSNDKEVFLSRLDYNGDTLWMKTLNMQGPNTKEKITNIVQAKDGLIATGTFENNSIKPYILKVDTLGNPLFSMSFKDTISKSSQLEGLDVIGLADSTFVLVGNMTDSVAGRLRTNGFVIKTDKLGEVVWSKKVAFPGDTATTLGYCTLNRNGELILAGKTLNADKEKSNFFILRMKTNGEIVWQKRYKQSDRSMDYPGGALYEAIDWGIVLIATGVHDQGKVSPAFIKTDTDGATGCETDITENILTDYAFAADTLVWSTRNVYKTTFDSVKYKKDIYILDIPVVGLDIKTFCPNEKIDWTFDASLKNINCTYLWSDGSTGETLRVFDEGEYSVTVTVGDNVCYTLIDTAKLDRYSLPQASIALSLGNFCTNGKQTLTMGYGPGHPAIQSVTWSTGEKDVRSIEIATPGTYTVTVVDGCGESAVNSIEVGEFPKPLTAVTLKDNINIDCAYGNLSGSLEAEGNATGLLADYTYVWNTGSTAKRLVVEYVETLFYSVTATDKCGNTASASREYEIKGENKLKLDIQVDETLKCTQGKVRLNAVLGTQSNKIKYQWDYQNNQTPSIEVTQAGVYRVTITDVCGNTLTASKSVEFKGPLDLSMDADIDYDELCENGTTRIQLKLNPSGSYAYKWSTGETTPDITVTDLGAFTVTVSDHCDNHFTKTFNVNFNEIIYGKIFFPDGTFAPNTYQDTTVTNSENYKNAEQYNRTFGPVDLKAYCLNQITDYELHVFNRWGQEVFVSNRVDNEWDGTYKGSPAPSDAYLWVVKYKVLGKEKSTKGSVTLIRL